MEGENLGEFGTGFNNSNYWLGQAFYFSGGMSEHPIFPHLRRDVEDFVGDCHDARCLLRTMGPKWEPKVFNNLCEDALLTEDPELLEPLVLVWICGFSFFFGPISGCYPSTIEEVVGQREIVKIFNPLSCL